MYPWENIVPDKDTTMTMIHECVSRGHKVALCTPGNLTIRDSITSAFCNVIQPKEKISNNIKVFYKNCSFAIILCRKTLVYKCFSNMLLKGYKS